MKKQSVQVNISRDEVSSYEGFEDSVYVESCKLLENTEGEDESGCLIYPRHAVSGAVEKLAKSWRRVLCTSSKCYSSLN